MSPDVLPLVTDALTLAACASVVAALSWYLIQSQLRGISIATAAALLCLFINSLAATHLGMSIVPAVFGRWTIEGRDTAAAILTVSMAIAIWMLIWKLLSLPRRGELLSANLRLVEEQARNLTLMEILRETNERLERRVAERTRELELSRRRFETALAGTNITVFEQDPELRYTWMYNPPAALRGVNFVGRMPEDLLPGHTAMQQQEMKRRVLATGAASNFEISLPGDGRFAWYEGRVEPIVENDRITGLLTVSIDITRHKQHEREIRDMMRELTHRSKNLMAVMQGIARQTATGTTDLPTFLTAFNGRLQAMSRVHEILVEEFWRGVWLQTLIDRERQADDGGTRPIIRFAGGDRLLSPEAAQHFALAFYELFNDARSWQGGGQEPSLWWTETDGQFVLEWDRPGPPSPGLIEGFGRIFLERHMPMSIGGRAWLNVSDARTLYRLEAPTSSFAGSL